MEAVRVQDIVTEQGLHLNNPELKKFINQKVDIIILPLQGEEKKIRRAWHDENSIMNTTTLRIGKITWTRDDLYDRKCLR